MAMTLLLILQLFLTLVLASDKDNHGLSTKVEQIHQIDRQIEMIERMDFLNQNQLAKSCGTFQVDESPRELLFQRLKIRKLTANKIQVTQQLNRISESVKKVSSEIPSSKISVSQAQSILMENISPQFTTNVPAKRLEGINFYNQAIYNILNNFYSVEGQKLFAVSPSSSNHQLRKTLVSSARNENVWVAQYYTEEGDERVQNRKKLKMRISCVEMKNKEFVVNDKEEKKNLLIEFDDYSQFGVYQHFFTFNFYQGKRTYHILSSETHIHFYFYGEKAQQLILDQNRTIDINQLSQKSQIAASNTPKIKKIVKLNTHLVILTSQNQIFAINLPHYLQQNQREYLHVYEAFDKRFETFKDIKFNDHDYREFFVIGQKNVYQYNINRQDIQKKYRLRNNLCEKNRFSELQRQKCTLGVFVLEHYLLIEQFPGSSPSLDFYLIERVSTAQHTFTIPFSHQSKCSSRKKFILSKNKNSHYILTLACFLNSDEQRSVSSEYLIMEHLNLQTSNQNYIDYGQIGGIDFTKFRLPMIVVSIGLVCYVTFKRSSKKSPEKQAQEQKMTKRFEEQILQTIKRQRQRQENIKNMAVKP